MAPTSAFCNYVMSIVWLLLHTSATLQLTKEKHVTHSDWPAEAPYKHFMMLQAL